MARGLKVVVLLVIITGLGMLAGLFFKEGITRLSEFEIELSKDSKQKVLFERIEKDMKRKVQTYIGAHIWNVSLNEVMNHIEEDVRVEKIHLRRVFPNKIHISVDPYDPVLILYRVDGDFSPVAADGSLLPPISAEESLDVPVLRGLEFFENEDLRKRAVNVIQALPQEGELSQKRISELRFEKKSGFVFVLTRTGHRILLGPSLESEKIEKLNRVLNYLSDRQIKWSVIDARLSKKIVVKPRNAS